MSSEFVDATLTKLLHLAELCRSLAKARVIEETNRALCCYSPNCDNITEWGLAQEVRMKLEDEVKRNLPF